MAADAEALREFRAILLALPSRCSVGFPVSRGRKAQKSLRRVIRRAKKLEELLGLHGGQFTTGGRGYWKGRIRAAGAACHIYPATLPGMALPGVRGCFGLAVPRLTMSLPNPNVG